MNALIIKFAEVCDKYVAPASCNTDNPPAVFTPPPVSEPVQAALATTGTDPSVFGLLAIALAMLGVGVVAKIVGRKRS